MSFSDTLEKKKEPAEETGHEGHPHTHDHEHSHGPVLNPDCTRELTLDVPADEVSKAYRNVTRNFQRYARIPGFRPGKVPEAVIKRKFAAEIRKDVIEGLLPDRFQKAVREMGVHPVGQPQVTELTVEEGQPMHIKAVFEFIPDFSIDGYKDVIVPKPPVDVTEDEFRHEMDQLRDSRATVEPVEEERPIRDGDWAQISYKGVVQGQDNAAPIQSEESLVEVGGGDTVEAFSTALRGATVGQTLHVSATYPAEYPENRLAGQTVDYEIDVKAIKKRTVPELNDDFAKELGGEYQNLSELENRVRQHLENRKRRAVQAETKDKLMQALIDRFPFSVPETLVQEQVDARLERGLRALAAQGMTTEAMRKLDFERLREAQRDSAVAEVKSGMLLAKIGHEENVEVSDEEVDHEIQMAAIQSREPAETLRARLTQDGGLNRIREQLKREKTAQLLYERLPG